MDPRLRRVEEHLLSLELMMMVVDIPSLLVVLDWAQQIFHLSFADIVDAEHPPWLW